MNLEDGKLAGHPVSFLNLSLPLLIPVPAPGMTKHHGVCLVQKNSDLLPNAKLRNDQSI